MYIEKLVYGGYGLGRDSEGMIIFVENAYPGEIVDVILKKVKRDYSIGRVVRFRLRSTNRLKPECDHFKECGGCCWMDYPYEEQLKAKKEIEGAIALRTKTLRDLDPEKDFSTIVKNYEKCEKNFKEALATLKAFEQLDTKKEPWLAEYVEKAKRTATLAYDGLIEVAKDMMTLYSTVSSKSSFRLAALRWVNKVLSYSPYDKDARDLRKLLTEQIVKEANR